MPIHNYRRLTRDITRATTETIATWIQRQRQLRKQIRNNEQSNVITTFLLEEDLQDADQKFHSKLLAARRGSRDHTETISTNEEPPD